MAIYSPISILERAQDAIANGNVQAFGMLTYQAATCAVRNAAHRLGYPISNESDVHRFLLSLDRVPPQPPPNADTAAVGAWIIDYSHIPPSYWATYAVSEGLRAIANLPDNSLPEAEDASYDAAQYDLTLLSIRDFVDRFATATVPEFAS